MTDNQDLDLSFLYEIADGSNEFIIESIDMFMSQTPELMHTIGSAIASRDWPVAGSAAHKLKPNLGFFGMNESQTTMQEIEHMAKSGAPNEALLNEKFSQVKSVITANLRKLLQIRTETEAQL